MVIIYFRFRFTTGVCLCDYRNSFFEVLFPRFKDELKFNPEDYKCNEKLREIINIVIGYEVVLNLAYLITIGYYYSKDVLDV